MAKIEANVIIDRPVEDVWSFMLDVSSLPKWIPGNLEGKVTSEGPIGMGTRFRIDDPRGQPPGRIRLPRRGSMPGRRWGWFLL